jgi:hypothetical protein
VNLLFWRKSTPKTPPLDRKYASAYQFTDRVVIHPQIHTPYGLFSSEPYQQLVPNASPEEIGRCVVDALRASKSQEEMPGGKDFAKQYLKSMGVKSNAELQRAAKYQVHIAEQSQNIELHPRHNGGASGDTKGYRPIPGLSPLTVTVAAPPAEIGAALLKAFSLCTY